MFKEILLLTLAFKVLMFQESARYQRDRWRSVVDLAAWRRSGQEQHRDQELPVRDLLQAYQQQLQQRHRL